MKILELITAAGSVRRVRITGREESTQKKYRIVRAFVLVDSLFHHCFICRTEKHCVFLSTVASEKLHLQTNNELYLIPKS
jgi:hypothetical protein